ncbi:kynurenine--oxoglutarate transaminase 3-like isoform X2 [Halichondria panicea]|uniref:kynurenine--oxoglutarate transaminase 3-like isoform X2 n=1 Tax=Halichondria panicea TaxID=6063 RepID=UPI00312BC865
MAKQNGATVKYVPLRPRGKYPGMSKDWAVDIQELEAAVSKNTKMLVINTPNNPFGKEGLVGVQLVVSSCEFSYSDDLSSLQLTWKVSSFRGY